MIRYLRLSDFKLIILFFVFIFLGIGYILRNGAAANGGYELARAQSKLEQLHSENTFLHLEIAHLKSPERIQEIATKKLGMVVPDKFFFANDKN